MQVKMRRVALLSVIYTISLEHYIDLHAILYFRFYRALTLVEIHF